MTSKLFNCEMGKHEAFIEDAYFRGRQILPRNCNTCMNLARSKKYAAAYAEALKIANVKCKPRVVPIHRSIVKRYKPLTGYPGEKVFTKEHFFPSRSQIQDQGLAHFLWSEVV